MEVTVASLGILQDYLSTSGKTIEIKDKDEVTVRELLEVLKTNWGENFYNQVTEEEELKEELIILLNGLSIEMKEGLDTGLKDGDRVTFSLFISGG